MIFRCLTIEQRKAGSLCTFAARENNKTNKKGLSLKSFQSRPVLRNMVHYLFITALFALLLVCGVFWGLYFSLSRSYQVFTPAELAKIARTIVGNLEVPMRNISILCLLMMSLSITFYPDKHSWNFYAMIASLLLIIGSLVITTAIEVPINNKVVTWTQENTPPDWEQLRNRWQYYNVVRTIMALLSFILFAAAVVD